NRSDISRILTYARSPNASLSPLAGVTIRKRERFQQKSVQLYAPKLSREEEIPIKPYSDPGRRTAPVLLLRFSVSFVSALALIGLSILAGCSSGGGQNIINPPPPTSSASEVSGTVTDITGAAVVGASVSLGNLS